MTARSLGVLPKSDGPSKVPSMYSVIAVTCERCVPSSNSAQGTDASGFIALNASVRCSPVHDINRYKFDFVGRALFGQSDAHTGWIWKAFDIKSLHFLISSDSKLSYLLTSR